jgi:DNA polymerase I
LILILDANNLAYRADQTQHLTTKQGEKVGAVYGVLQMIQSYLKPTGGGYKNIIQDAVKEQTGIEENFSRIVCAWDGGKSKWRTSFYPDYKAQRQKNRDKKTDEEKADREAFINQMNLLHEILPDFGIKSLKKMGWEADDIIYTLTQVITDEKCIIVSTDQDMLQLVSDNVYVWSPFKELLFTPENFKELTGVAKESYLDYRILVGDSSDNIPGINGIGEKKGIGLMTKYKSIKGMIPHRVELSKSKVYVRIFENPDILDRNDALMNMERIPMDVLVPYVSSAMEFDEEYDSKKVKQFLMKRQFVSILKVLGQWEKLLKQLH